MVLISPPASGNDALGSNSMWMEDDEDDEDGNEYEDVEIASGDDERAKQEDRRSSKKKVSSSKSSARRSYLIFLRLVEMLQNIRVRGRPLISGLDRVVFGTASAAEAVSLCGIRPPQYLFYMISGAVCDVLQLLLDYSLHTAFAIDDPSICWALSFTLSIVARHTTHRYLVFGMYVGGYYNSLLRMYGGYSIIIVLSTIFNILMTKVASISHYVAWIITLLWTGIVNYFILKKLWSFGGNPKQHQQQQQQQGGDDKTRRSSDNTSTIPRISSNALPISSNDNNNTIAHSKQDVALLLSTSSSEAGQHLERRTNARN